MNCRLIEELVIDAKNGDMNAKEQIINEFTPFIINFSNKTFIEGYETQDIHNECFSILLRAIKQYNPNRHRFVAYATNSIKNSIYCLIRDTKNKSQVNGSSALTFTGDLESLNLSIDGKIDNNLISICESKDLNDALSSLSDSEIELINFVVIQNIPVTQFAKLKSTNYTTTLRNKKNALKKLGNYLNKKGGYLN
jgi:RNA polymerase sigma factor (sigma-70 family)